MRLHIFFMIKQWNLLLIKKKKNFEDTAKFSSIY